MYVHRTQIAAQTQHTGLQAPIQSPTAELSLLLLLCRAQNVQDQLLLWQAETQRVTRQAATYYSKFEDDELFAATLHTAQGHGSVLWWYRQEANPEASFILIKRSGELGLSQGAKAQRVVGLSMTDRAGGGQPGLRGTTHRAGDAEPGLSTPHRAGVWCGTWRLQWQVTLSCLLLPAVTQCACLPSLCVCVPSLCCAVQAMRH
jgi:hypothetical protein